MIGKGIGVGGEEIVDVGKHKGKANGKYYQSGCVVKKQRFS